MVTLRPTKNPRALLPSLTRPWTPNAQPTVHTSTLHPRTSALNHTSTLYKQNQDELANTGEGSDAGGERPYFLHPVVMADREEREALGITRRDYGVSWKASYRSVIGKAPVCVGPWDRQKAVEYLAKIERAIRKGHWSPAERGNLKRMREVWARRVSGQDVRFNVAGTMGGKLAPEDRRVCDLLVRLQTMSRPA